MEDNADTPRVCEACGDDDQQAGCPWCNAGFQDSAQQARWRQFRQRMSKISGTYSMFQSLVEDAVSRLDALPCEEAQAMSIEGREILTIWLVSDPGSPKRDEAAKSLMSFHRRAMDFLIERGYQFPRS